MARGQAHPRRLPLAAINASASISLRRQRIRFPAAQPTPDGQYRSGGGAEVA